jgi:hypothetical protein
MNWYAGGFVDDNDVVIFVHDANGLGGDRGLVPVQGVGYDVAVLQSRGRGRDSMAVDDDGASLDGMFLQRGLGLRVYEPRLDIGGG